MLISELRSISIKNNIPIILDSTRDYLESLIEENNIKSILEVGSAVGYSAIVFALKGCLVTTLEKDFELYKTAQNNIKAFNLENSITIFNEDAKTFKLSSEYKFDMLFIDASKANYKIFFNNFEDNLKDNGIVVSDNMNFHNVKIENSSKNLAKMLTKLNDYKSYMLSNPNYETTLVEVGDGLLLARKK